MKRGKYKLEDVRITATYDKAGNETYLVVERWVLYAGKSALVDEFEYKYQAQSFDGAKELAKKRIAKYNKDTSP